MKRTCLSAALLAAAFPTLAADLDRPDDIVVTGARATLTLDRKATASRLDLSVRETPASIEVIDGDLVRLRGDRTVVDAVTRGTGITSVATPGNGLTALSARGFSGQGSVMTLVDGVRLYVGNGTLTFPFDPWTVDRIEVLRGPASVLYGEGAIGGAINIVSKRPQAARRYGFELGYGSFDTLQASGSAGGAVAGPVSYQLDASYRQSGGWLDRNDNSASFALSGALRFMVTPTLTVVAAHDHGYNRPFAYFGVPLVNGALDRRLTRINYNVGDHIMRFDDDQSRLTVEWRLSEGVLVRNIAYALFSDREWRNAERFSFLPATQQVRRSDFLHIAHDQEQFGNRLDVSGGFALGAFQARALAGFEINRIDFRVTNNAPFAGSDVVGAFAFDPGVFASPTPYTPAFDAGTDQRAVFAETQLKRGRLALVAGLRQDWITIDRTDLRNAAQSFRRDLEGLSWRAGVVWDPLAAVSLYAQYATGSDPVGSLITTTFAQRDFGLSDGQQWEAGAKAAFAGGRGEVTFAAYDIVKNRLLTPDPDRPQILQQVGQRSARGLELAISYQITRRLGVEANGTVLDARFDDFTETVAGVVTSRNGNTPPAVPERAANAWITWSPIDRLQARAGLRHVGARFTNNANTARLPEYTVVDLGLRAQLSRAFALDARVGNVGDELFAVAPYAAQWLLGDPRRVDVRVIAAF